MKTALLLGFGWVFTLSVWLWSWWFIPAAVACLVWAACESTWDRQDQRDEALARELEGHREAS